VARINTVVQRAPYATMYRQVRRVAVAALLLWLTSDRAFVALQLSERSSIVTNALLGRAIVYSNKKSLVAECPYEVYDWPAGDCAT